GVRMFGPNANLSQDLEPEYIAVSADGTHAMVVLQENNAFAKVDLTTLTVTDIIAMGMKDYSLGMYDFSDKDDGVNLATYANVYGMYQPDAISTFSVGGSTYYVTANEGDARDYWFDAADEAACLAAGGLEYDDEDGCLAYSEEVRLDDLDLDDTVFPNEADLLDEEALGRLKTTTANNCGDSDGDGDLDFICSYGTRSFSIWDSNGALVWDSGDSISALMASQGEYINSYTQKRNDDKGAEPEGVVVGEMFGKTYVFVGLERAGGILVYDVSDPTAPVFDQYIYLPDHVSPEGLDFISAADSPNGAAMLVVAHEVSGTVAILQPFV
ncbi:MAG: choice-of-anchor I family protein, partial [Poseidonia sp.]